MEKDEGNRAPKQIQYWSHPWSHIYFVTRVIIMNQICRHMDFFLPIFLVYLIPPTLILYIHHGHYWLTSKSFSFLHTAAEVFSKFFPSFSFLVYVSGICLRCYSTYYTFKGAEIRNSTHDIYLVKVKVSKEKSELSHDKSTKAQCDIEIKFLISLFYFIYLFVSSLWTDAMCIVNLRFDEQS